MPGAAGGPEGVVDPLPDDLVEHGAEGQVEGVAVLDRYPARAPRDDPSRPLSPLWAGERFGPLVVKKAPGWRGGLDHPIC